MEDFDHVIADIKRFHLTAVQQENIRCRFAWQSKFDELCGQFGASSPQVNEFIQAERKKNEERCAEFKRFMQHLRMLEYLMRDRKHLFDREHYAELLRIVQLRRIPRDSLFLQRYWFPDHEGDAPELFMLTNTWFRTRAVKNREKINRAVNRETDDWEDTRRTYYC